jgi:mannose-6-phosphate isomerase
MPKQHSPLKLSPVFQNYLWGGTRLRDFYQKSVPADWVTIAESWELSTHPHGQSLVNSGSHSGRTFSEYLQLAGPKVLGSRFTSPTLPILIKYIDAMDNLSIQVHPHDDYARKYANSAGKSEMWYIVAAEPDAFIYYGFNQPLTRQEFSRHIKNDTLTQVLQKVPAKPGDVFFIPAGTLHSIGKGLLVAEIQQCCDLTYRVYDYGRRDQNGCTRPLHLKEALDVTNLQPTQRDVIMPPIPLTHGHDIVTLVTYKDFIVKKLHLSGELQLLSLPDTYQVLMAVDSTFDLHYQDHVCHLAKGETIFLPADLGTYHIDGQGDILLITDN